MPGTDDHQTYRVEVPLRWSDMDAYGHVNNVVYLTYLEEARVDMLFALSAEYGGKALSEGVLVAHHEIDYKRPLVYHPRGVDIEMWVGSIRVGETVKIAYVDQSRGGLVDPKKTLWEVVSDGLDHINVGQVEMPSRAYVSAFGFKGPDQQKPAGVLSGGERNRLNLALTLKIGGNLLLLDEPTNDLDVETLSSLENALLDFPGCAVVVSHDRWFLDRVATHILAYEGDSQWFWFEGNFESYEKNKVERLGADAARPHRATYRKLTRG